MNWSPRQPEQASHSRDCRLARRADASAPAERRLHSAAATAHPLATEAATEIFRAGGNAVDAAVAAAWALSVCEPGNSGLGGQTIMLIRLASPNSGRPQCVRTTILDGHSRAPAAVSLETVSRAQQRSGYRATTVPTTPLVLESARQRYGRLSLAWVLGPAIRLAQDGFPVTRLHRRQLAWCSRGLQASPSAARLLLSDGRPYEVGHQFRQPELAGTLRRLAHHGVDDFYHGHLARQIAEDMRRHGGLLAAQDLAGIHLPAERVPISTMYRGCLVHTTPPPSGGAQILLGLELLEQSDLGGGDLAPWYQALGEATYTAFCEREEAAARGEELAGENRAARRDQRGAGWALAEEPGETTHLCTADAEGNVVSLTQSIQSLFGARVACEPCGFLYNNYLTTCPREPHPRQLAPGCQPRSNSAPTFVSRCAASRADSLEPLPAGERAAPAGSTPDAYALIALGGAGSRRTTSAILHTISGAVDRERPLAQAVAAPRFHVRLSRKAWLERAPETEPLAPWLAERFRRVQLRSRHSYAMGCVQAIEINQDGTMAGTADPRREGNAVTT